MNLKVNYFEHCISFDADKIQVFEIENKKMFYRFVKDLYLIKNADEDGVGDIYFFNDKNEEINLMQKINVYSNFFELELNSKKNLNSLTKVISENISDKVKDELLALYKKILKKICLVTENIKLPITINDNLAIEDLLKLSRFSINNKNDLLDNLLTIIDMEKIFKLNDIIFFINLKEYLNKDEINELYKYAIYNNVKISLIDSKAYGAKLNYENKIIIDSELSEIVL